MSVKSEQLKEFETFIEKLRREGKYRKIQIKDALWYIRDEYIAYLKDIYGCETWNLFYGEAIEEYPFLRSLNLAYQLVACIDKEGGKGNRHIRNKVFYRLFLAYVFGESIQMSKKLFYEDGFDIIAKRYDEFYTNFVESDVKTIFGRRFKYWKLEEGMFVLELLYNQKEIGDIFIQSYKHFKNKSKDKFLQSLKKLVDYYGKTDRYNSYKILLDKLKNEYGVDINKI